jgi:hypothetical protein
MSSKDLLSDAIQFIFFEKPISVLPGAFQRGEIPVAALQKNCRQVSEFALQVINIQQGISKCKIKISITSLLVVVRPVA